MSAIATSAAPPPAMPVPGAGAGNPEDSGSGTFSRMLQGGGAAEAPRPDAGSARQASGKTTDAAGDDARQHRTAATEEPAPAEDTAPVATDASASAAAEAAPEADTDTDDGWPPAGLASLLDPATARPAAPPALPAQPTPPAGTAAGQDAANLAAPGTTAAQPGTIAGAPLPAGLGQHAATPAAAQPADGTSPGGPAAPAIAQAAPVGDAMAAGSGAGAGRGLPEAAAATPAPATLSNPAPSAPVDTTAAPFAIQGATPVPGTPTAPALPVSAPHAPVPQLHGDGFADDVGTHVRWLAGQQIGHAHIRISPQELGPVEIRMRMDGDRISAEFTSAQPEVRQALENSLPRLREMLGQHGFQLAHASVGQQSQSSHDGNRQGAAQGTGHADHADPGADTGLVPAPTIARQGLLDAYA